MPAPRPTETSGLPEAARTSLVVDARGLEASGIGRYLRETLQRLLSDSRLDPFILAGNPDQIRNFTRGRPGEAKVRIVPFDYPFYSPAAHARWGLLEARGVLRADVAYFPHYDVPVTARYNRNVVVVQDLIHFQLPELFPRRKRLLASAVLRRAVRRGTGVIVSSEATRRDLVRRHPEIEGKVRTVPHGVSAGFAAAAGAERVGDRPIDALRPYLLCVGNRKPHKNFATAVEALAILRKTAPELRLVLVGRVFDDDGVRARATALGQEGAIVELEGVGDGELRGLYARAEALIFPSLYEGYGLPILEAMALGVPVVASDRASVPEVVGGAGIIVGAEDAAAMAEAVVRIREQPDLRARLINAGLQRAANYTWDASARRLGEILIELARPAPGR